MDVDRARLKQVWERVWCADGRTWIVRALWCGGTTVWEIGEDVDGEWNFDVDPPEAAMAALCALVWGLATKEAE